ncbi:hypothetical protein RHGRI_004265 [Rhododendron griersonianum]|uniref:Rho GDP-dissociation inhibitor 1 n=1 Tax=Rhododendron griersonianum TaxID=479676 RepID=A0AAV6L909_9ERIC|nr:hypothetical protein RHGRI_004265 [Rhododendron griersonianum]
MSLAIGVESSSSKSKSDMGFDENKEEGKKGKENQEGRKPEGAEEEEEEEVVETGGRIERKRSESSICDVTEDEDESDDDESLRKWKEQLLGSVDINAIGETLEPEVKILSLAIKSPGRPDIFLPVPESGNPKGLWFTLKEGSRYSLNFTFQVNNNIVSGLKYINTVWKTGVKVDSAKEMVGTFSPQLEPYTHEMPEETTPTGFFARGSYTAKTKFVDDDNKCYLEINYTFDIRKDWQEN